MDLNTDDRAILFFQLNCILCGWIEIEETKQAMTEVIKTRQEIESMYTKMLEETDLKLKDGQNNMVVRRVRGAN